MCHDFRKNILATVNPQKVVKLSFPTLVFFAILSFEVFYILLRKSKIFLSQTKEFDVRISNVPRIENGLIGILLEPTRNQLKSVATIF